MVSSDPSRPNKKVRVMIIHPFLVQHGAIIMLFYYPLSPLGLWRFAIISVCPSTLYFNILQGGPCNISSKHRWRRMVICHLLMPLGVGLEAYQRRVILTYYFSIVSSGSDHDKCLGSTFEKNYLWKVKVISLHCSFSGSICHTKGPCVH